MTKQDELSELREAMGEVSELLVEANQEDVERPVEGPMEGPMERPTERSAVEDGSEVVRDDYVEMTEVPPEMVMDLASLWVECLKELVGDGSYEGEVPHYFKAEFSADGSLVLQAVQMPTGVVMVSPVRNGFLRRERFSEGDVSLSEVESTGRRKINFRSSGIVSVEGGK